MEKQRSLNQQYREWTIKEYPHWTLLLHDDQRSFTGVEFVDGKWGKNYAPYETFKPSVEILTQIRNVLKETIV